MEAGQKRGTCDGPLRVPAVQDEETVYESYDSTSYKLREAAPRDGIRNLV